MNRSVFKFLVQPTPIKITDTDLPIVVEPAEEQNKRSAQCLCCIENYNKFKFEQCGNYT